MTEQGILPGLWPIHGDGVLARQGGLVLLIHPVSGRLTDRLLALLADAARAGQSGLRFTELVSAEFDADAAAADPAADRHGYAVVAFGPAGGGTAVAVYGTGWANVTTAYGTQRLTTGEPYGRLRCVLPSTLTRVSAGVQPVAGDGETDPYLRLAEGVVRAVGLVYAPAEMRADAPGGDQPPIPDRGGAPEVSPAAPAASAPAIPAPYAQQVADAYVPPAPQQVPDPYVPLAPRQAPGHYAPPAPQEVPGPADGGAARPEFISVSLASGLPDAEKPKRDPLPLGAEPPEAKDLGLVEMPSEMVEGVYCKNEHFNDPDARYCAVCGVSMSQLTKIRQQGKRPPLGVLILADGSVCQVDADYVMGREPTLDSAVAEGRARPLRLMGARGSCPGSTPGWNSTTGRSSSPTSNPRTAPNSCCRGSGPDEPAAPGCGPPWWQARQIRLGGEYGLQYDSHRHR